MALQKNLTAQLTYTPGATPNTSGNWGVSGVARTPLTVAGSWDVSLQSGYTPGADFASVQILGDTPGAHTVSPVPGDTSKIRVLTVGLDGLGADLPWSLAVYRNALLTDPQAFGAGGGPTPPPVP